MVRDHLRDLRVAVAKNGAHLSGSEVEDRPARFVINEATFRPLDNDGGEASAISDQVIARPLPKLLVLLCRSMAMRNATIAHIHFPFELLYRNKATSRITRSRPKRRSGLRQTKKLSPPVLQPERCLAHALEGSGIAEANEVPALRLVEVHARRGCHSHLGQHRLCKGI